MQSLLLHKKRVNRTEGENQSRDQDGGTNLNLENSSERQKIRVNRTGRQYHKYARQCRKGTDARKTGKLVCRKTAAILDPPDESKSRPLIRLRIHFYDVTPAAGSSMDCRRQDKYVLQGHRQAIHILTYMEYPFILYEILRTFLKLKYLFIQSKRDVLKLFRK